MILSNQFNKKQGFSHPTKIKLLGFVAFKNEDTLSLQLVGIDNKKFHSKTS